MASSFLLLFYYITYNRLMTIQENARKVNQLTATSFTQTINRKRKEGSSRQKRTDWQYVTNKLHSDSNFLNRIDFHGQVKYTCVRLQVYYTATYNMRILPLSRYRVLR